MIFLMISLIFFMIRAEIERGRRSHMRTYTFNECYELLHVDPKTFRGWLKEANIDPNHQVSRADRRIRFLTEEQIDQLAVDHGRLLRAPSPEASEVVSLGAFKLLLDRVQRMEEEIAQQGQSFSEATERTEDLVTKVEERLQEYWSTLDQRIAELALGYTKEFHELGSQLQATQLQVDQRAETFSAQIAQMRGDLLDLRDQMKQWQQQQESSNADQMALLSTLETSLTGMQVRQNDLQQQLSMKALDQTREIASLQSQLSKGSLAFASQLTALETEAEASKAAVAEGKSRSDALDHRLTEIFGQLQEEITTRQAQASEIARPSRPRVKT
jgi:hypothetical protein